MKPIVSGTSLQKIVERFAIDGLFMQAQPYGAGHIHDTYLVEVKKGNVDKYILQKINGDVFTNIPAMMHNVQKVSQHLNKKISAPASGKSDLRSVVLIPAREHSRPFCQDSDGHFWRACHHLPHAENPALSKSPNCAFETGRAFGDFLTLLCDFPVRELVETIPRFHALEKRLETFDDVVRANPAGRVAGMLDESGFVKARRSTMLQFSLALADRGMPQRVTHNDTKSNNVLFNESGRAVAVIDLDTVMPGYVHYDFGDAIRTIANPAAEDEGDLDKVKFDAALFEGFAQGYLGATKEILVREEVVTLAFSARFMTFLIGLRFLTDHIDGDQYYKTQHSQHNLQRARVQFKLLTSMEEQALVMEDIVAGIMQEE